MFIIDLKLLHQETEEKKNLCRLWVGIGAHRNACS